MAGKPIFGRIIRAMHDLGRPASAEDIGAVADLPASKVSNSLSNHIASAGTDAEVHRVGRGVYAVGPSRNPSRPQPTRRPQPPRRAEVSAVVGQMAEIIGTTKTGVMFRTESGKLYDGREL